MPIINRTFFDHLGIAHLEKIHSQTLSWILSKDNDGLAESEKEKIVTSLFDSEESEIVGNITEYDGIDLILILQNSIICIENKFSSSVRSKQLKKYEGIIEKKYGEKEVGKKKKFYLLSLIDEDPRNEVWKSITYFKLLEVLKKANLKENTDGSIIKEYITTLENLKIVVDNFIKEPTKYMNVFKDGHKRKSTKLIESTTSNYNSHEIFIRDNQLETIFQKLYYQKVIKKLKCKVNCNPYIFETRGHAILAVDILKKVAYKEESFNFGFSFQNGTFKIFCIVTDYPNSKVEDIPKEVIQLFKKFKKENSHFTLNKGTSKGQYSLTQRNTKEWLGIPIEEFAAIYDEKLKEARELINIVIVNLELKSMEISDEEELLDMVADDKANYG